MDEWWEFLQGLTEEETDALDRREFKGWSTGEGPTRVRGVWHEMDSEPVFCATRAVDMVGRLPGTYYQQTAYLKHAFERYEKDPQSYEGIDDYVREYKEFARVIQRPLWNVYNLVRFMASHRSEACSTTRAYDDFPDTDENGEPWPEPPFDCIVTACRFFPTEVHAQPRRRYAARRGRRHDASARVRRSARLSSCMSLFSHRITYRVRRSRRRRRRSAYARKRVQYRHQQRRQPAVVRVVQHGLLAQD